MIQGYVRAGAGPDGYLRADRSPVVQGYLYAGAGNDGYLRSYGRPAAAAIGIAFPTQYAGLRYYKGTVRELCLVDLADAPAGDQWRIKKGGTTYAVYLVDTSDADASPVRVQTGAGVKAARFRT